MFGAVLNRVFTVLDDVSRKRSRVLDAVIVHGLGDLGVGEKCGRVVHFEDGALGGRIVVVGGPGTAGYKYYPTYQLRNECGLGSNPESSRGSTSLSDA